MLGPVLECGEIQGQPLRLIPSEAAHLPTFVRWLNDPAITRFLGSSFSFSQAMEEKWFEGTCVDPNRVHWAIALGEDVIGATGVEEIHWLHRTGVTGILIGEREHWGKGIASAVMAARSEYAFNRLNLVAVYTEIFVENQYSLRAAKRNGYVEYGRRPYARYLDGRYIDAWLGVLSREDWLLRPNA